MPIAAGLFAAFAVTRLIFTAILDGVEYAHAEGAGTVAGWEVTRRARRAHRAARGPGPARTRPDCPSLDATQIDQALRHYLTAGGGISA